MTNIDTGSYGEKLASDYLVKQGYKILEKNYKCKAGEIDIIGIDQGTLCFIEVKTRTSRKFGLPEEIINKLKLARMARCVDYYNNETKNTYELYRLDVVSVELEGSRVSRIELIKNASLQ